MEEKKGLERMKADARKGFGAGIKPCQRTLEKNEDGQLYRCAIGAAVGGWDRVPDGDSIGAAVKKYGISREAARGFYMGWDGAGRHFDSDAEWREAYDAGRAFWEEVNGRC